MGNELIYALLKFRKDRQWERYHTPKELATAIAIEAGELQKEFLWRTKDFDVEKIKSEMADIYIFLLYLSFEIQCNLDYEANKKLQLNCEKYPIESSKDKWS